MMPQSLIRVAPTRPGGEQGSEEQNDNDTMTPCMSPKKDKTINTNANTYYSNTKGDA
jgi:hypothetical protein